MDQLNQISALDTAITLALQDIDRSLSETNQTLTERIIPAVTQYSQQVRAAHQNTTVLETLFTHAKSLNAAFPHQSPVPQLQAPGPGLATVPEEGSSDFDSFI